MAPINHRAVYIVISAEICNRAKLLYSTKKTWIARDREMMTSRKHIGEAHCARVCDADSDEIDWIKTSVNLFETSAGDIEIELMFLFVRGRNS